MLQGETRERCPHCGAIQYCNRVDLLLTPFQALIFDTVQRAGEIGIAAEDLRALVYRERAGSLRALRSNIWKLNDLLAVEGYRIKGDRWSGYRLIGVRS